MASNSDSAFYDKAIQDGIEWGTPFLVEKLGQEQALSINAAMQKNYEAFKPSLPKMKTKLAMQLILYAIRSLLLYQVIKDEMDQDNCFALITDYGKAVLDEEWIKGFSPLVRGMMKNRYLFPIATKMSRQQMHRSNDPNGWKYEFLKKQDGHLLDFNITQCGMLRFLTENGAPELTPVICKLDFHMAENFLPPCAKLVRTQTLAEGADFCDFRYCLQ